MATNVPCAPSPAVTAPATRCAASNSGSISSRGRSVSVSWWARGTTSTCPGNTGLMSRNATTSGSSSTTLAATDLDAIWQNRHSAATVVVLPSVLAAIPYTTFPKIDLGFVEIRTFGLMVAIGVMLGALIASRLAERFGVPADDTISLATRLVVAGVIGARITWVLTHPEQIDSPIDIVAVWQGGLQFSGGFIAAIIVGFPTFRKWARLPRWRMLDTLALGLAVGLAVGRIGCYSVGEHLGAKSTTFFLATRYDGGSTREGPPEIGQVIHNTALYEMLGLLVLAAVLWWVLRQKP